MTKIMLIDATHAEETRVAVVEGNRLVDFDYESQVRKQLKSSIFLAKVTRVEPSLQAAFVNFGGNRHGFLPFSEIHPDYFRIPIADREALLAAQAEELERMAREEEEAERAFADAQRQLENPHADDLASPAELDDAPEIELDSELDQEDDLDSDEDARDDEDDVVEVGGEDKPLTDEQEEAFSESQHVGATDEDQAEVSEDNLAQDNNPEDVSEGELGGLEDQNGSPESASGRDGRRGGGRFRRGRGRDRNRGRRSNLDSSRVEMVGGDGVEGDRPFRFNLRRNYKIQEVVKRGQIMLVQVSKEERGNKGAAVTTYLSLPGRYCVLMPNSPRGGGVSRKIANFADRRKMKEILSELSVPEGMSVILRTAGVTRSKDEIKRDLDYLLRLWDQIREETLQSSAPALIYEEGNLIKRSIRDLYGRDIEDVYVSGTEGYKTARDFMKMLMPSHENNVHHYDDRVPLFHKWRVEGQIGDIGKQSVTLRSGGYLVINPTEALVSVDVNSGKSTKERHIEETALKTNLEAADEVARQLRLRDLGGLVVIDFIDMEDRRNNRKVENRLREALSSDRARIQVGRISSFGLLELSRQRLNPSLSEMQFQVCSHCEGTGRVPTLDFAAIKVVRALEEEGIKGNAGELAVTLPSSVALYILNNKRQMLAEIEKRYGLKIFIKTDDTVPLSSLRIDAVRRMSALAEGDEADDEDDKNAQDDNHLSSAPSSGDDDEPASQSRQERDPSSHRSGRESQGEGREGRGRRNRGRRGGRNRDRQASNGQDRPGQDQDHFNTRPTDSDIDPDLLDTQINGNVRSADEDNMEYDDAQPGNDLGAPPTHEGRDHGRRQDGGGRHNNRHRGGRNRGGRGRQNQGGRAPRGEGENTADRSSYDGQSAMSAAPMKQDPAPEHALRATRHPAAERAPAPTREYEVVNEAPEKKKKGWWSRMTE
jgi:ribonuclease E